MSAVDIKTMDHIDDTDIIIIGGGPAGLTAAIYAMRAGMRVILLESSMYGGQIANTPEVENYPSIRKIEGWELAQNMYDHAKDLGLDLRFENVNGIETETSLPDTQLKAVVTDNGWYGAKAVIIANGARRRHMGCTGEEKMIGRGVSFCASCDGSFFRDKDVAVIGGGNTAVEDAIYLSNICRKVYLVHRRDEFRAQKNLVNTALQKDNIEFKLSYVPDEVIADETGSKVAGLVIRRRNADGAAEKQSSEKTEKLDLDGIFVAIGLDPDNKAFGACVELDEYGYIAAGEDCMTSAEGIYAAGDTRTKPLRQIVTACSDGAVAATGAVAYINEHADIV